MLVHGLILNLKSYLLNHPRALILLILLLGAGLRFYKLDWDNGISPHPDENTVAASVIQMSFPNGLHPHLFTYGSFITYLIFFTKLFLETLLAPIFQILDSNLNFHPLLIGRFYSALFSTLTILVIYHLTFEVFKNRATALLAAFLTATTAGLIQQSHFTTPETYQTFFIFLALLFLVKNLETLKNIFLITSGISFGLALGSKISSVIFGAILALGILIRNFKQPKKLIFSLLILIISSSLIFVITSPFWLIDFSTFKNTVEYESKIASGQIQVFYTRQFVETIPVFFQLEKIYPFVLGPTLLILGILGFLGILINSIRKLSLLPLILTTSYLLLFFYHSFLFVKWTRYMTLTLPFFSIFAAYFLSQISQLKFPKFFLSTVYCLLISLHLIWALACFSIYTRDDVRLQASDWIVKNLPAGAKLIVEGANTVDVPLAGDFHKTSLFLYELDNDIPEDKEKLIAGLVTSDYFIVQSRRVFFNHQRLSHLYPKTANFYDKLFDGSLGFSKIKEISSYPSFLIWEFPDEAAEETFTVFDHPVLKVYKKEVYLTDADYRQLLAF